MVQSALTLYSLHVLRQKSLSPHQKHLLDSIQIWYLRVQNSPGSELDMLIERYNEVKKHVEEACKRVGRDPREVTVIAVSKTKPLEMVEELRKEKVLDFGENKVQEIRDKFANISWPVRWHLIGHLQTNKIKYMIWFSLIVVPSRTMKSYRLTP